MKSLPKAAAAVAVLVMAAQPLAALAQNYQPYQAQNNQPADDRYASHPYSPSQDDGAYRGDDRDSPPPPPPPGDQRYQNDPRDQGDPRYQNDSRYGDNYADNRDAPPPPPNANDRRYDGYCYERKDNARATGTILGALAGAALGNSVSRHYDRGFNTIAGAAVGAAVGNSVGDSSVTCYGGRYYAYDQGYYAPPAPPEGYEVVYYEQRPPVQYYERVYTYRDYYPAPVYRYHGYYGGRPHYGYGHRW